jgi:hypothetical protein
MTNDEILNLKTMGGVTIREFLLSLLRTLWIENAGFSGKRPFGESDWQYEVYTTLAKAKLIDTKFDDEGYPRIIDTDKGDSLVLSLIDHIGSKS